jgi:hypothetical protein
MLMATSVWRFFNPVPVLFWFFDRLDKNITGGAQNFNTPALGTDPVNNFFLGGTFLQLGTGKVFKP